MNSSRVPRPAVLAGFIALYAIAVLLAERSYGSLSVPSPFWLPDSVLLAALLVSPRSQWWVFALVIWPVRLVIAVVPGTPLWFQLVTLANDMMKGLFAAWLLDRFIRKPIHLNTLQEFMVFLAIAAAAVPAVSAMAAAPARYALGEPFWPAAARWFLGNAVSQVVVTPTILYWCRRDFGWRVGRLEAFFAALGVAGAVYLSFFDDHSWAALASIYLPIPFLIWVAVRLGPFGAANALSLLSIVAMWGAVEGRGILNGVPPGSVVLSIQLFLLVVATSILSLAILVREREALQSREAAWNRRLIDAQDEERSRIASELHDDIGQKMAVLLIDMYRIASSGRISDEGRKQLRLLLETAARLSTDIRHVSHNLHPLIVDTVGIETAVRGLCQRFGERSAIAVELRCDGIPPQLPRTLNLCLYRLVQEALQNVAKHSGASGASVEIVGADGRLIVSVSDSGRGFDPAHVGAGGLGLISMRERVRSLGGRLEIETTTRTGTRIRASIPLPDRGGNTATRVEAVSRLA